MFSYKQHVCNVPGCAEQEYRHHMCQRHYDFYSANSTTAKFMEEKAALEGNTGGWRLKVKRILQVLVHYSSDLPMPLIEHFPLEHVFLGELYSIRGKKTIDSVRVQHVIDDFNIPENGSLSDMRRILNNRDIETSELGPINHYLLKRKDLPSKWPVMLSVAGLVILFCMLHWLVDPAFQLRGVNLSQIKLLYWNYAPFVLALAFFVYLGLLIPSQYNFFVGRCYNMTLFRNVEDNADFVNEVKFVKERKARSESYYATVLGSSLGLASIIIWVLLGHGTASDWHSVVMCLTITMAVVPLVYSYNEMALFYPVIEALKRKRISIDLYNADHRGGLKRYHRFLYLTFLYNEGLAFVLAKIMFLLPISRWWLIVLALFLLPRFNHAGWAMLSWSKTIADFYKERRVEKERLVVLEGSAENMGKMELLKKTYPVGIIPAFLSLCSLVLIPYLVNQLPDIIDFLILWR